MKILSGMQSLGWVWLIALGEVAAIGVEVRPLARTEVAAATSAMVNPVTPAQPVKRVSLQPIVDFQPFGAVPVVAALASSDAAPTEPEPTVQPQGLTLQGVLLPGGGPARVLLSMDGGPAQSYGKGDALPGGGTLFDVAADQIWIEIGDQKRPLGFVAMAAPAPAPVSVDSADNPDLQPAGDAYDQANRDAGDEPSAKPARTAKSLPQPDLRHLIPAATDATALQP